jgi:hypothetical protein
VSGRRVARAGGVEGLPIHVTPEALKRPDLKPAHLERRSYMSAIMRSSFSRVIICCAFRKLSGALGSFRPGPIKRRPPAGLYNVESCSCAWRKGLGAAVRRQSMV